MLSVIVVAQSITGEVVDKDGYALPLASISYKGHHIATTSDIQGKFTIERHDGWLLTISSLGFGQQVVKVDGNVHHLKIVMKEEAKNLNEVVVKSKRGKYKRKENPAVALMRRVIAAKKQTHLKNYDYYQYDKYQKLTLAVNDITPQEMEGALFNKTTWLKDQVEVSPYNHKLTLPISIDETMTQEIYRKNPKMERTIVNGKKSKGLNKVLQTGEILNTVLKEVFMDVDIYDNQIKLLQYHFMSPIADNSIYFYRFYIEDTVYVGRDECYHLQFIPNNQQDFGFRGELYVVADSSLQVKKCNLTLPKSTDVNWVDNMQIQQEYTQTGNGEWVLSQDDMIVEMSIVDVLPKALVVRNTHMTNYSFEPLPDKLFKGKAPIIHDPDALLRDEAYWREHRTVTLTHSEASMDDFVKRMENAKGYKWIMVGVRALMENYVETASVPEKNLFNIGPVNTVVSYNVVDHLRLRASGKTTAHLNPHFFFDGYYAYGTASKKHYYGTEFTYSLNRKQNMPFEFPARNITFESTYDVMSAADKFLSHHKDNIFMAFRTQKVNQMYFYNLQRLSFEYETRWGLGVKTSLKTESNIPTADLVFKRVEVLPDGSHEIVPKIRMTEWKGELTYAPGKNYINTKQHRFNVNPDAPEYKISHTIGFKHFLGGNYNYHLTDFSMYKRLWLGSFGFINMRANLTAQWSRVPFPLLVMAPGNLSLFDHETSFSMLHNMEFLADRYAFWSFGWNLNGKLFNRIPLLNKLKWREYICYKGMYGYLTEKNNPLAERNQLDGMLFMFPDNVWALEKKRPYGELVVGVHNIFKFFEIEYVRRLAYTEHADAHKNGIRLGFSMSF